MKLINRTAIRASAGAQATVEYLTERFLTVCTELSDFRIISSCRWGPVKARGWTRMSGAFEAAWCMDQVVPSVTCLARAVMKLSIAARAAEPDLKVFGCHRLCLDPVPSEWVEMELMVHPTGGRVFVAAPTSAIQFSAFLLPPKAKEIFLIPCEVSIDVTGILDIETVGSNAMIGIPRKLPGVIGTKQGDVRIAAVITDGRLIECGGPMQDEHVKVSIQLGSVELSLDELMALRRGSLLELDVENGREVVLSVYGVPWAKAQMHSDGREISIKILELVNTTKLSPSNTDSVIVNTTTSGV